MVRIRELREAKGMQQKELAIDLCVSQPTISDWESGRKVPSARSTQKLAAYFNVSIDYLLGKEEESERAIAFLPERLEEAMNGMSCEELAQKFDGSAKVISLYLEGKRKPSKVTLHLMALYLGVNPEWLYGLDVPQKIKTAPEDGDGQPSIDEKLLGEQLIQRLCSLTPEEQGKVDAFIQGLIASR